MSATLLFSLLMPAQATPVLQVAHASTPASLTNALAVRREWTMQEDGFCKARAAANAYNAYPRSPLAKVKYVKTFSFRGKDISSERSWLDTFGILGFQSPFPWQEGQWLARQLTSAQTPQDTYLLEMQDRARQPGEYSTRSSICLTVYGIRQF